MPQASEHLVLLQTQGQQPGKRIEHAMHWLGQGMLLPPRSGCCCST